jgi:Tol biopolymer transport system component
MSDRAGMPNIWRMDIDGANPKRLTDTNSVSPHVSPDGRWVVYSYFANKYTTWRVDIEGGQPVQVTDKYSEVPVVSPDGKQIACLYFEDANAPPKIALLPFAGGPPSRVLPLANGNPDTRLRWMPDGSAIVYGIRRNGVTNLWAQPVDGSPPRQITNFPSDRIFAFDFSRDGKQVALARGTLTNDVVLISGFK